MNQRQEPDESISPLPWKQTRLGCCRCFGKIELCQTCQTSWAGQGSTALPFATVGAGILTAAIASFFLRALAGAAFEFLREGVAAISSLHSHQS